jgi:hypothetical protein
MSWRERDWARLNDDERSRLFSGGTVRRRPVTTPLFVAVLVSLAATAIGTGRLRIPIRRAASDSSNVVRVHWRATDIVAAPTAGRICFTDTRHGRMCASYAAGQRPADALTQELERRGLEVKTTG